MAIGKCGVCGKTCKVGLNKDVMYICQECYSQILGDLRSGKDLPYEQYRDIIRKREDGRWVISVKMLEGQKCAECGEENAVFTIFGWLCYPCFEKKWREIYGSRTAESGKER